MKYRLKMKLQETAKVKGQNAVWATPYVNTRNYKRYEKQFYSCHSLRKEKAWHVLFMYLERRMRGWWD